MRAAVDVRRPDQLGLDELIAHDARELTDRVVSGYGRLDPLGAELVAESGRQILEVGLGARLAGIFARHLVVAARSLVFYL